MNPLLKFLRQNIWVGISKFLIPFYLILGLICYFDLRSYWKLGLNVFPDATGMLSYYHFFDTRIVSVVLISLLAPVSVTILKYLFRDRLRTRFFESSSLEKYLILICHLFFTIALLVLYYLSDQHILDL